MNLSAAIAASYFCSISARWELCAVMGSMRVLVVIMIATGIRV
jgi:hypothetical protein